MSFGCGVGEMVAYYQNPLQKSKPHKLLLITGVIRSGSGPFYRVTYLDRQNFDITAISLKQSQEDVENVIHLSFPKAKGKNLKVIGIGLKSHWDFKSLRRLWDIIRKGEFDIVQTCHAFAGSIGIIFSRLSGIPVIVHFEGTVRDRFSVGGNLLKSVILSLGSGLVSVSESVERSFSWLEQVLLQGVKKRVIYNGIDLEEMELACTKEEIRKRAGVKDGEFVIGYTGRFIPEKNLPTLIHAVSEICRGHSRKIRLLLVGDGAERKRIEEIIDQSGIKDQCSLTGWVDRQTVYAFLHIMDVFVLPSFFEGLSWSLVQAMGVGLPVIASDIPPNMEIVTAEVSGLIFRKDSVDALADRIRLLMSEPVVRRDLGENARRFVMEKIHIREVTRSYEEFYLELLHGKDASRERNA